MNIVAAGSAIEMIVSITTQIAADLFFSSQEYFAKLKVYKEANKININAIYFINLFLPLIISVSFL